MFQQIDLLRSALEGSYAIERELGSGGIATVYLAQDLKHDRKVAVKVLRPELAAALGPDRFPREIRILARLQHPHIRSTTDGNGRPLAGPEGYTMVVAGFGDAERVVIAGGIRNGNTIQRIEVPAPIKSLR